MNESTKLNSTQSVFFPHSVTITRSSGLYKVKVNNHIIVAFIQKGELFGYAKILDLFVLHRILFAINTQPGFTEREKKRSLLKSLKILYVKKMSQRQKGMQNSLEKPPHW
ncbi:hypothetical protein P8452_77658 [Trifolium repens]|nr:hypothetical protein P8452_77658 [Trifolium repens]